MRKNKLKELFKKGEAAINGWLEIPSSFSAESMSHQGWDSLTIDMQHGAIDNSKVLEMFQAISTTDVVPMARINWNEPGQIMKVLDFGAYGIICPMISNRDQAEKFIQACKYPPEGYRSFGPTRGLQELDKIMKTPGLDGIYIGPADLSLSIGEKPGFDKPEKHPTYEQISNIIKYAKKNNLVAGIHNATPEYARKMIDIGFQIVTVGSDKIFMNEGAKSIVTKLKFK